MDDIGKPQAIFSEDEEAKLIYNDDIIQQKRNGDILQSETKRNKIITSNNKDVFQYETEE